MFKREFIKGKQVLKSSLIDDNLISAFFTTRDLPLKCGEKEDLADEVEYNRKLVCEELKIPYENLIIPEQTHSDNIRIIKKDSNNNICQNTDALIANEANIALALNFADCVPIIFYDHIKKTIGATHAGWRGTAAQIAPKTVRKMTEIFGTNPKDVIALIGPAIGKCCFEAKEDVLTKLKESIENNRTEIINKTHADLKLINKFQLLAIGVEKIDVCEYCTSCQNELFFSYRKEKGNTARHSAVIMLK